MNTAEILKDHASVVAQAKQLNDKIKGENRPATDDESAQLDELLARADKLEVEAKRSQQEERLVEKERLVKTPQTRKTNWAPQATDYSYNDALRAWALIGKGEVKPHCFDAAAAYGLDVRSNSIRLSLSGNYLRLPPGVRSLPTTSLGGLIQPQFSNKFEVALKYYGGMLDAAEVFTTETGNTYPWPYVNDTSNTAEIVGEEGSFATNIDPTLNKVTFGAFKYDSGIVVVSLESLQDSAQPLDTVLTDLLSTRISRKLNADLTTGAGTTLPFGIVTQSTLGVTAASTSAVTYGEIIQLIYSIDPAYLNNPGCAFMMHAATWAFIEGLTDGNGRPLVAFDAFAEGVQRRIRGYPVILNNSMTPITSGATSKIMVFGDLTKYKVRLVKDVVVTRLVELYAATGDIGFVAVARADGNLVDAGTHPVKHLKLHA